LNNGPLAVASSSPDLRIELEFSRLASPSSGSLKLMLRAQSALPVSDQRQRALSPLRASPA
jgi:hypothetical protein